MSSFIKSEEVHTARHTERKTPCEVHRGLCPPTHTAIRKVGDFKCFEWPGMGLLPLLLGWSV